MTLFDEDIKMAKRISLVTESDQCHASSATAPHASLVKLFAHMRRLREQLLDMEENDEELDAGVMADQLRVYADSVRNVINKCNKGEQLRSDTVFEAIDWYNKNLEASKTGQRAMYEAGKKKGVEQLQNRVAKEVQRAKAEMEKKMEEQKQAYEARLAKPGSDSASNPAEPSAALAIPTPTSSPVDATPTTAPLAATSVPATAISSTAATQIDFWKSRYENVADQNAELRKAKVEESVVQDIVQDEIQKIKRHYEMQNEHQKARAEELADANAELRRQLQERASPGEKRKAHGEEEASPKRARSLED